MKIFHNWKIPLVIILLVLSTSFIVGCSSSPKTSIIVPANGETKIVKLTVDSNYIYNPQEIRVKAGTTLRIEADPSTNIGGMDTVVVEGYNVQKKISTSDNVLEFLADKPGIYEVHYANGMGNGRLIVE